VRLLFVAEIRVAKFASYRESFLHKDEDEEASAKDEVKAER
jgi:hypothetical protein